MVKKGLPGHGEANVCFLNVEKACHGLLALLPLTYSMFRRGSCLCCDSCLLQLLPGISDASCLQAFTGSCSSAACLAPGTVNELVGLEGNVLLHSFCFRVENNLMKTGCFLWLFCMME